jgi:hypothetical protein
MRLFEVRQTIKRRALLVGPYVIRYGPKVGFYVPPVYGMGIYGAWALLARAQGFLIGGGVGWSKKPFVQLTGRSTQMDLGMSLIDYRCSHIGAEFSQAWQILFYVATGHIRGRQYLLGLPARGQRTHSNARNTEKHKSGYLRILRSLSRLRLFTKYGSLYRRRVKAQLAKKTKPKGGSAAAASAKNPKAKAKRAKLNVWR